MNGLVSHLERPCARGHVPAGAYTGAAGGAACGDLIRVSLAIDAADPDGRIAGAGFDASGCGAAIAAGSAAVALVRDRTLLDAARIDVEAIVAELGGLAPAKRHAAELATDALHRALGAAARRARLAPVGRRTLVAMSGGVDSAVAALLLAGEGREAVAVTLELWADPANDGERSCCSAQAVRGARAVAHGLGLPHISIDLREDFRAGVVEPWLEGYAAGETPNPCVRCNGSVRIDAMLDLADRLGAAKLATGHYARLEPGDPDRANGGGVLLRMAVDQNKDQSYALSAVAPVSLARLRLPLGELTKPEVRSLALQAGLPVAGRADSQDLCFLAGTRRGEFLARHGGLRGRTGAIVDREGRVLGEHGGVHTVTVGQRRGFHIARRPATLGPNGGDGDGGREPMFVLGTDSATNVVTVGPRSALLSDTVSVRELTLHRAGDAVDAIKVRYRGERLPCRLPDRVAPGEHRGVRVRLREPAERTAPGQIACLYAGELIVGHGTIA